MKSVAKKIISKFGYELNKSSHSSYVQIYEKYKFYTMVPKELYLENLYIVENFRPKEYGDVVECGVWRGGMIAGISEILNSQYTFYLFDSFEGLPKATEIDGQEALNWQNNTHGESYHNNCQAEMQFAIEAMKLTNKKHFINKGWFSETLPNVKDKNITILRLDADWYESTSQILVSLYPQIIKGGLIIIDDYYTWEGCSKAVHDYLSNIKSKSRINSSKNNIAYIIKQD